RSHRGRCSYTNETAVGAPAPGAKTPPGCKMCPPRSHRGRCSYTNETTVGAPVPGAKNETAVGAPTPGANGVRVRTPQKKSPRPRGAGGFSERWTLSILVQVFLIIVQCFRQGQHIAAAG